MEDRNKQYCEEVYKLLCDMLDQRKVRYEKNDKDLIVRFEMAGEKLPIRILMLVDKNRNLLKVLSPLPFVVPEDKRQDMAFVVNALNNQLPEGNFDYECTTGRIGFKITSCFEDCEISARVPEYLLFLAGSVVDQFNEKLLAFSKGTVSFEQVLNGKNA